MEHMEPSRTQESGINSDNGKHSEPGNASHSFNYALESYNEVSANNNGQSYSHDSNVQSGMGSPRPEYRDVQKQNDERADFINTGTTLYVSKISYRTTEDTLFQEFSKFGKVSKFNLVVDPHTKESRGFAFISFESVDDANAALAESNSLKIDGVPILIEQSRRSRPRSPTPGRYSGAKPLPDNRFRSYGDRRDHRDHYDRPIGRSPYDRYPPRDVGYEPPRDKGYGYSSRYGMRDVYPESRLRERDYDRHSYRSEYFRERVPYPARDPRDFHGYSRESRMSSRDFRAPRERYPEYSRGRDPRNADLLPYGRENVGLRHRDEPIVNRIRDDRSAQYPPAHEERDFRPRYE